MRACLASMSRPWPNQSSALVLDSTWSKLDQETKQDICTINVLKYPALFNLLEYIRQEIVKYKESQETTKKHALEVYNRYWFHALLDRKRSREKHDYEITLDVTVLSSNEFLEKLKETAVNNIEDLILIFKMCKRNLCFIDFCFFELHVHRETCATLFEQIHQELCTVILYELHNKLINGYFSQNVLHEDAPNNNSETVRVRKHKRKQKRT